MSAIVLAMLTLGAATASRADAPIEQTGPSDRSLDRYSHIWTAKPFVAATVITPQAESIAQRFAVTGYARLGGQDMIFILDRVGLNRFTITSQKPENGVELVEVTDNSAAGLIKARVRSGGEVAELLYDAGAAGMPMGGESPGMGGPNGPIPMGAAVQPPPQPGVAAPNQVANQRRVINTPPRPVRVQPRRPIQGQ